MEDERDNCHLFVKNPENKFYFFSKKKCTVFPNCNKVSPVRKEIEEGNLILEC